MKNASYCQNLHFSFIGSPPCLEDLSGWLDPARLPEARPEPLYPTYLEPRELDRGIPVGRVVNLRPKRAG